MLKFKKMLKQALALTCALALLVCALPIAVSADAVATQADSLLLFRDASDGVVVHPGGAASTTKTFSASVGASNSWQNNFRAYMNTPKDISDYDTVSFTLNIANQAGYDHWKYHTFIYLGGNVYYPMPTDLTEGDNIITLDLNIARKGGIDLTAFNLIGILSVYPNGWWHNGAGNSDLFFNIDTGYFDDSGIDFTFTVKDAYANKNVDDGSTLLNAGAYSAYGDYVGNLDYAGNNVAVFDTPCDLSSYKYLQFDAYISDADSLRAEEKDGAAVWNYYILRFYNSTENVCWHKVIPASELNTGYNRITIPVSEIPVSHRSGITTIRMYQENCGLTYTPSKNYVIGAVNFRGTNVRPMQNVHPYSVFEKEGVVWNWSKEAGGSFSWQDCTYINGGNNINVKDAQYLEFDVYANTDLSNFQFWLSTAYGDSPDRRLYNAGNLVAGHNHIVVDMTQYIGAYEPGGFDKATVKSIYLQAFDVTADCNLEFSNIAFTSDVVPSPAMNNVFNESVFASEGVFSNNYTATTNEAIAFTYPNNFPLLNGGNTIDTTAAQYIEFDIYTDVATTNTMRLWLSSGLGTDSGRRFADAIPALKSGWNHVCVNLDTFAFGGGEWAAPYDRANILEIFVEGTPVTANTEERVPMNIRFANIAFTKVAEMNNNYPIVTNLVKDGLYMERSYNVGTNSVTDWSGGWGTVFINGLYGPVDNPTPTDVTNAKCLEFDFYASADIPGAWIWLSKDISTNPGKRGAFTGPLTKGWNHICLALNNETFNRFDPGYEWDLSAIKSFLVEFVAESTEPNVSRINYKVANMAFTTDEATVTWNVDGNITNEKYVVGEIPSFKGSTDKADEGNVKYTFTGWDKEISAVTGDVTYTATYTSNTYFAEVGGVKYETLAEAVVAAEAGATVTLLGDVSGAGVKINKDITIDFGGYTYTVTSTVGSTGTETNCFQLLKDNTVKFMNGTVVAGASSAKILTQNYSDLTLENVKLIGNENTLYVASNNNGSLTLAGSTEIIATEGNVAFDVYYWPSNGYGTVAVITADDFTGKVEGAIEQAGEAGFEEMATIAISGGTFTQALDEAWCADGFVCVPNGNGEYNVVEEYVIGDINGDTAVDMRDLIALKNATLDNAAYSYINDVDLDGNVNATDFIALRKALFASF